MISEPKHGWCSFDFGGWHAAASYLTCVPCDLLSGFIKVIQNPNDGAIVRMDAEGYDYYLVLTDYNAYVIAEDDPVSRLIESNSSVKELAKELLKDLKGYERLYAENFTTDDDPEEINVVEHEIREKIAKLKGLID